MRKLSIHPSHRAEIFAWIYLAIQQTALSHLIQWLNSMMPNPLGLAGLNFLIFALNFICTALIFVRFLWHHAAKFILRPGYYLLAALSGFGMYMLLNHALSVTILMAWPDFANVNNAAISTIFDGHFFLMAVGTVILVPLAEELLFRGLIFRALYRKNSVLGYVISILVFSAIHVLSYIGRYDPLVLIICFIQYIPGALILSESYARTDCIFVPVLIHMTLNFFATISMR